jgi:hypothetical protein
VEVNPCPGSDVEGGAAIDHCISINNVGFVVAPNFVGAQNDVGNHNVGIRLGLRYRQDAVGVVKVRVPSKSHQVNVLAEAALFNAKGIFPKHFAVATGRCSLNKNPDAIVGRHN